MYETPPPSPEPPQFDDQPPIQARRNRWLSALAWIAGGLATLILVTSVGGYVLYRYYNGRIGHVQIVLQHPRPPAAPAGTQNFLLVGVDSRVGTGNEYQNTVDGVDPQLGENSDTTILAHLDRDGTTTLLSFPRDMYVTIPSFKHPDGVTTPAHRAKINSAIGEGGPGLLISTIDSITGVAANHYVEIDLGGFRKLDDAVGGVDVCLKASSFREHTLDHGIPGISTNLSDGFTQFKGKASLNHLSGAMALAFVRQRHGLPGGDIDRIKRQQVFLGALFRKALSTGVLLNPAHLTSLLSSLASAITLGKGDGINTSPWDLARLSSRMKGLDPTKIRFETVATREPTAADGAYQETPSGPWLMPGANGGSVQMYDQGALDRQLAPIKDKPTTTPSASGSPSSKKPLTVAPSDISVTVENGTRRSGLAGSTAAALAAQGFQVGPAADADSHDIAQTVIHYGPGQDEAARTLQAAIPGATLQTDNTVGTSLVLVLGDNFGSVSAVHVGQTPSSTPATASPSSTPSATPSAPANDAANAAAAGTPCANPIY
jgi:LCP family protein required for cell wall assembly